LVLIFYNLALLAVLVLGAPFWLFRMATSGKYRAGLSGRLGRVPRALVNAVADRDVVWLHAVSVGEVIAISRVVTELRAALPEYFIAISTTTRASQQLARERFGADSVFYFPLDFTFIVRRYLRALRPRLLILAETEFWPSLLTECARKNIPVAVINARISDRSLPRYRRLRWLWRRLLSGITLFLAQSEEDARRLQSIGAPADRIRTSGNLKFDVQVATDNALTAAVRAALPPQVTVLVAGSTIDGEESALLEIWPQIFAAAPQTIVLLAPRHPERFAAVARLLDDSGIAWHRRSEWLPANASAGLAPLAPGSILLLDSIGELAACYALATVAFVGGSLVPTGGHNPLEPAQFGVPVVMGYSLENFRAIADAMLAENALVLVDRSTLAPTLIHLLTSAADAAAIGAHARTVYESQSGATARTVSALLNILHFTHRVSIGERRPLLQPLTPIYSGGVALKNRLYDVKHLYTDKLRWPVISIGSLAVGGAGKTPFTMLLADMLREHGWQPDVLTRGYGRKGTKPEQVNPNGSAAQFGDEPLLLAQHGLSVFVSCVRFDAGALAEKILPPNPRRVHLLDDGFQHRRLHRDLDIVLVTDQDWYDELLPVGNLREPLAGLQRADAIVLREEDTALEERLRAFTAELNFNPQILCIRRTFVVENAPTLPMVFCGIARPDVFHDMLRAAGHNPSRAVGLFRDHQRYTRNIINGLVLGARSANANGFITTEKDAVKLTPDLRSILESVGPIAVAKLNTSFCDPAAAMHWLLPKLTAIAARAEGDAQ
jgi:3-deoxy-D-manno-octulosonic-acid transferase